MENEKLITILPFATGYESAIIRGRLESEGIRCFLQDDHYFQLSPFVSNAKLQVRESDLNQAIEILKETGYIKDND